MVYKLLSEWCVATSFYQSSANHVYFYALFNLRNLLYLIFIVPYRLKDLGEGDGSPLEGKKGERTKK